MQDKRVSNPSIPLTEAELRAIGNLRTAKQRGKRLIIVLVPALFMLIAGVAFHRDSYDVGFLLIVLAIAWAMLGLLFVGRHFGRLEAKFAKEHQGAFWNREPKDESK